MINLVDTSIIVQNLKTILYITMSCAEYFPISFDTHYASRADSEYLEKVRYVTELLKKPSNINATKIDSVVVNHVCIIVNARVANWKVTRKAFLRDFEEKLKKDLIIERGSLELAKIIEEQGFEIA